VDGDAGGFTQMVAQALAGVLAHVFNLNSRFHWLFLGTALLIAAGLYWLARRNGDRISEDGLVRFIFPREVWLHPSSLLDLRYVLVDSFVYALTLAPFAVSTLVVAEGVDAALSGVFGRREAATPGTAMIVLFMVAILLAADFCRWVWHFLLHRVPVLWEFHKVHHSATVLVPTTLLRIHPLERFGFNFAAGMATGAIGGAFLWLYRDEATAIAVMGAVVGRFIFNLAAANLRHSHIWWSWGPIVERIMISPAQHQVHHSQAERHWNRNYGSQFALWDWMAGSLYLTGAREEIVFGIGPEDSEFNSVWRLYTRPLAAAARRLGGRAPAPTRTG